METVAPIFVLSLPRSGSTLLQRLIGAQPGVSTVSEPWLLLPFLSTLRDGGVTADYDHALLRRGLEDFWRELPEGIETYRTELRTFALRLYAAASPPGTTHFLDKTPRYHLVVSTLFDVFPEAKFVFLWRNPLAVVASAVQTWARGRWSVHRWHVDLFDGLANLVSASVEHGSTSLAVRYEDLTADPAAILERVDTYLGLPFDPGVLETLSGHRLWGRLGDQDGSGAYASVSDEPVEKWKQALGSPVRKRWCHRYLDWVGPDRLAVMGYDLEQLRGELDGLPSSPRWIVSDGLRLARGRALRGIGRAGTRWG
jgi:sulfotransferase family protein